MANIKIRIIRKDGSYGGDYLIPFNETILENIPRLGGNQFYLFNGFRIIDSDTPKNLSMKKQNSINHIDLIIPYNTQTLEIKANCSI
jgi:hypothetical protein